MSFLFEERMLLCFLTTSLVHSVTIWSGFFYATGIVLVTEKNFMLWGEYPREKNMGTLARCKETKKNTNIKGWKCSLVLYLIQVILIC